MARSRRLLGHMEGSNMRVLMISLASILMMLWALPVLAEDDAAATDTATEATTEGEDTAPPVETEPPSEDEAAEEAEAEM